MCMCIVKCLGPCEPHRVTTDRCHAIVVSTKCVAPQGHFSAVMSLALAPDNWTLLSSSRDRTVHLWDLRTHAKVATVPIHEAVEGGDAVLLVASDAVQALTTSIYICT
jgi:WD40 repeat protein